MVSTLRHEHHAVVGRITQDAIYIVCDAALYARELAVWPSCAMPPLSDDVLAGLDAALRALEGGAR